MTRRGPLGLLGHVVRTCQPTARADQCVVILASRGKGLLEVRDRIRLSGAPLRYPQREQQRSAISRLRRLGQRPTNVTRGDLRGAPSKRVVCRVPQPPDDPATRAGPHASKCAATRASEPSPSSASSAAARRCATQFAPGAMSCKPAAPINR